MHATVATEMAQTCLMLFALILALSVNFVPSMYAEGSASETEALIAFKKGLTDPENVLESWDPILVNPCTWFHITCNQDNLVTRVELGESKLSGNLVPELGQLPALEYLLLGKNGFTGIIPAELGKLKSLKVLDLGNNQLTGKVPSQISNIPGLRSADFSNNGDLCWDFWPTPVFKGSYNLCQKA